MITHDLKVVWSSEVEAGPGMAVIERLLEHNAFSGEYLAEPSGFLAVSRQSQEYRAVERMVQQEQVEILNEGLEYVTCRFTHRGLQQLHVKSRVTACRWTFHADQINSITPVLEWTSWELLASLCRDGWRISMLQKRQRRQGLAAYNGGTKVIYLRERLGGA